MSVEKVFYLVNVGSSSQKNLLARVVYDDKGNTKKIEEILSISAERLNIRGSCVVCKSECGEVVYSKQEDYMTHSNTMKIGIKAIKKVIPLKKIDYIINRIVNLGEYMECTYLTDETEEAIRKNINRAPEHNPSALECIEILKKLVPDAKQILVPDTAPHATIPKVAYTYGIPLEWSEKYNLRKVGFHGSVISNAINILNENIKNEMKLIIVHLGKGCSITCVKDGKVLDTSMGQTPLVGTIMGTRCGDIDPTVIEIISEETGLSLKEIINILNKKSGLLGISGISNDFRDNLNAAFDGNERAKLAVEIFIYRVSLEISKYIFPIGGVNQIVFSGGIGENSAYIREKICENFKYLGVNLDIEKNEISSGIFSKISSDDSKVEVYVIPADEAHEMIRQTINLITKKK